MLSEADGRTVLKEAFESQGYAIQVNYSLDVGGVRVELDGYDPEARVGYEYITSQDGLSAEELEQLMEQRHCELFLIDEKIVPDAPTLLDAVWRFFRERDSRLVVDG